MLGILQLFAPEVPQIRPDITLLTSAIPAQQATVATLQNQTNLLNQLDDLIPTLPLWARASKAPGVAASWPGENLAVISFALPGFGLIGNCWE